MDIIRKCRIAWRQYVLLELSIVHLQRYHTLVLGLFKDFLKHVFRSDIMKALHHVAVKPVKGCMNRF